MDVFRRTEIPCKRSFRGGLSGYARGCGSAAAGLQVWVAYPPYPNDNIHFTTHSEIGARCVRGAGGGAKMYRGGTEGQGAAVAEA